MPGKGWKKAPDGTWTPPNQMRHTLEIEEDTREWLDEKIDDVLGVARLQAAIEPVSATLGNPVALPLIAGGIGVAVGYLILRGALPEAPTKEQVIIKAQELADWLSPILQGAADVTEAALKATSNGIRDGIVWLWERFQGDPLFGFGGKGPTEPFDPLGPPITHIP